MLRTAFTLLLLVFASLFWNLHAQTDTIWNTVNMGEVVIKGNKLICLPRVKGGGTRAYLIEIDENTLGLAYFKWGSSRGAKTTFEKAYIWNSSDRIIRRWRRVKSNLVFSSGPRSHHYVTLCGDFSNISDVCFYYDREIYSGLIAEESFEEMINRHGLIIQSISSSEHRKYLIRSFTLNLLKYVAYFILLVLGIALYGRRLMVQVGRLVKILKPSLGIKKTKRK